MTTADRPEQRGDKREGIIVRVCAIGL